MLTATLPRLSEADLRLLGLRARRLTFQPGQIVVAKGTRWPALLLVRQGHLDVVHSLLENGLPLQRLAEGECFLDLLLLDDGLASHHLLAGGALQLDAVEAADLEGLVRNHPHLGVRLFRSLASSLCRHLRSSLDLLHSALGVADEPASAPEHLRSPARLRRLNR